MMPTSGIQAITGRVRRGRRGGPVPLTAVIVVVAALSSRATLADWTTYLGGNDRAGTTDAVVRPPLHLAWIHRAPRRPEKAWSGPRATPIEGHVMLPRVVFDAAPQPILVEGRLYFGSTVDHSLHCVDLETGAPLWRHATDAPIRLAPTFAHGNVYFGSDDGVVRCLEAATGRPVWEMRVGPADERLLARGEMISRWPVRTGVLVDGDVAYFGAGVFPHEQVFLCAAEATTGRLLWRNDRISQRDAGRNELSPQGYLLANDRHLYVPSGRSLPVAVSKETGDIVFQRTHSWRTDAGGVVGGTKAVLGDGQIYAGGPHHFLALDETTGDVGAAYLGGRLMVLRDEFAYLVDGERLFCVDRAAHVRASQEKQRWFLRQGQIAKDRTVTADIRTARLAEARARMEECGRVGIVWSQPCPLDGALIATDDLVVVGGTERLLAVDRHGGEIVWEAAVEGTVMGLAAVDGWLAASTDAGHVQAFSSRPQESVRLWPAAPVEPFADDAVAESTRRAAAEILGHSGQRSGYALVLGGDRGRLAYEIARQSELMVLAVEPDAAEADAARTALEAAGIHGTSVTIVPADPARLPFSNYFANLVVSADHLQTGHLPADPADLARFVKPCGGVVMFGRPGTDADDDTASADWLGRMFDEGEAEIVAAGGWRMLRRGKLPGAGEWTHQYGNPANTASTDDRRVRDGLGVLWYGDPGPSAMINRHEAAGAPLSTHGRMFIQGTDSLMAYDAYNGSFLWSIDNPGAIRTGVFNNRETHNLAATDEHVFMAIADTCRVLDAATGRCVAEHRVPPSADGIERAWAYVAVDGGQLFGTSTIREDLEEKLRRRGLTVTSRTDAVFAADPRTGAILWTYRGTGILHTTITIGPDAVYLVESSLTPEERQAFYRSDKGALASLGGALADAAEEAMKRLDARRAVCLDRATGEIRWSRPVDVTDTTNVAAGGGSLTLMVAEGCLVLCGANANGHYWKQFLAGEFAQRKLVVLDAATGADLWARNANYMNRPVVVGGQILAEPWAFDLRTGAPRRRPHPLTGEESDWQFSRPGHHCGVVTATPQMMFFRSGFIGYYDLYEDSGTRHFAGQRSGCWVNAIPGNGLVMIPEASAGCVCQFSIASTVVLEPVPGRRSWGIMSATGPTTPVQRIGVNLGAPGDRKDGGRREWLGFPRPRAVERLEFVFDIQPRFAPRGGWFDGNPDTLGLPEADLPWVFASGARGLEACEIELLGTDDPPAAYDVQIFLAGMTAGQAESLDVRLQGAAAVGTTRPWAGGGDTPLLHVRRFAGVPVDRTLRCEFAWPPGGPLPRIAAIEVTRQEAPAAE
jgi:outer membrane protein assembly factor BamB